MKNKILLVTEPSDGSRWLSLDDILDYIEHDPVIENKYKKMWKKLKEEVEWIADELVLKRMEAIEKELEE